MTEKLKLVVKREIAILPEENQKVINASGWEQASEEIGKKYLLNESELNDFQVQTLLVLIGLSGPEYYAQSIENEVGTSKDEADKISEEVFRKIFTPINDILLENIKKSEKIKNSSPKQTLNFILSGGDYSAFITPTEVEKEVPTSETNPRPPTLADIKANVQKTNAPAGTTKMTDMKSKFTI